MADSIVLATNVIVSALLLKASLARQVFDKAISKRVLLFSFETLVGLEEILQRIHFDKYISISKRREFLSRIVKEARINEIIGTISVCRDKGDNNIVETALVR